MATVSSTGSVPMASLEVEVEGEEVEGEGGEVEGEGGEEEEEDGSMVVEEPPPHLRQQSSPDSSKVCAYRCASESERVSE